jgi:Transcriptional regulator/sugar kinase
VWNKAIEALSLVLAQITLTLDPECIVIGGGLSGAGEALLRPLRDALTARLEWRTPPRLVGSALGDSAGLWGAAVLGCEASGSDAFLSWKPEPYRQQGH